LADEPGSRYTPHTQAQWASIEGTVSHPTRHHAEQQSLSKDEQDSTSTGCRERGFNKLAADGARNPAGALQMRSLQPLGEEIHNRKLSSPRPKEKGCEA